MASRGEPREADDENSAYICTEYGLRGDMENAYVFDMLVLTAHASSALSTYICEMSHFTPAIKFPTYCCPSGIEGKIQK